MVGPPLWKIWKSIGMIRNPILMGKCQKWQPNHQPDKFGNHGIASAKMGGWSTWIDCVKSTIINQWLAWYVACQWIDTKSFILSSKTQFLYFAQTNVAWCLHYQTWPKPLFHRHKWCFPSTFHWVLKSGSGIPGFSGKTFWNGGALHFWSSKPIHSQVPASTIDPIVKRSDEATEQKTRGSRSVKWWIELHGDMTMDQNHSPK